MSNEKMENLLNLALDATEREREKSLDLDTGYDRCAFHGFFEDEKESRINGWRRNQRSAQSLLPAVRAVDGGFNAVGYGAF